MLTTAFLNGCALIGLGISSDPGPDQQQRSLGPESRAIVVEWERFDRPVAGMIDLQPGREQDFTITMPDGSGLCYGTAFFEEDNSGTWEADCDDGTIAFGTVQGHGDGLGSVGEGEDQDGNKIRFHVSGR